MNINEFNEKYINFKDSQKIDIICDHPRHDPIGEIISIGKQPAKRNILKNSGEKFICRKCVMKYNNSMTHIGIVRQNDEIINVHCPHPSHEGNQSREMKKSCYYGIMEEPYLQICKSCAQKGKIISEKQKLNTSETLKGTKRSDEFKEKLSNYMKNTPEGIARTQKILDNPCRDGMLGKKHSQETKKLMSCKMSGRIYNENHRKNISEGRKKMIVSQGGFSREHRENLSKSTVNQYSNGFNPQDHFKTGWHFSAKAGRIFYRSSYEKKAYLKLDQDISVKSYKVENIVIDYFHPIKKITSNYIIDLEIEYIDGSRKIVEVKPKAWLEDPVILAKKEAAIKVAEKLNVVYEIWTEVDIFGIDYTEKDIRTFIEELEKDKNENNPA